MIVTTGWLSEWIELPWETAQLAERLTMAGFEVESVRPAGTKLPGVVAAEIRNVLPHPTEQNLRLCRVYSGKEELDVVTAAPEIRLGGRYALALPGARLAGGREIREAEIHGVRSSGMFCSALELGLENSAEGLYELDDNAPPGKRVDELLQLDDTVLVIAITPNRGDCLSIFGMAREISALSGIPLLKIEVSSHGPTHRDIEQIRLHATADCPRYAGRIVHGLRPGAHTPVWMRERLRRCGIKPVSPVVDVTNYVMLELGQPMHAFDLKRLDGAIEVRHAQAGERLFLLDGSQLKLSAGTLVIADQSRVLALAGIMGGKDSAIEARTRSVFLEAAHFSPDTIRLGARRYGLQTESSTRFERGVDPNLPVPAIHHASRLLQLIAGGESGPLMEKALHKHLPRRAPILLRRRRLKRMLGMDVAETHAGRLLARLARPVSRTDEGWRVTPPGWRFDLTRECDLVEDVARLLGYDSVPATLPSVRARADVEPAAGIPFTRLRTALVDRGYHEAITYSFVDPRYQERLQPGTRALVVQNPISESLSRMRTSLLPGLMQALVHNRHRQQERIRLFELGRVFSADDGRAEEYRVAGVALGGAAPEQWAAGARTLDFFDIKGDVEALLNLTKRESPIIFKKADCAALHPGQGAELWCGNERWGALGALQPDLAQALDIGGPVQWFELNAERLAAGTLPTYRGISRFPGVRRDLALVVDRKVSAQSLLECVSENAGDSLSDLRVFDVYEGGGIAPDQRSVAIGLTLQESSRTLTDQEVDALIARVVGALEGRFAARLRV
jgi:phenylalanyl-tRNA synthetase beta chain